MNSILIAQLQRGAELRYYYMQGDVALFSDGKPVDGVTVALTEFIQLRHDKHIEHTGRRDGQYTDRGRFCDLYTITEKGIRELQ